MIILRHIDEDNTINARSGKQSWQWLSWLLFWLKVTNQLSLTSVPNETFRMNKDTTFTPYFSVCPLDVSLSCRLTISSRCLLVAMCDHMTKLKCKEKGHVANSWELSFKDSWYASFVPFYTCPPFCWLECRRGSWNRSSHLGPRGDLGNWDHAHLSDKIVGTWVSKPPYQAWASFFWMFAHERNYLV